VSTTVEIFPDSETLVGAAGQRLIDAIQSAVAARGQALIVLTGGGNGIGLLRHLARAGQQIDWSRCNCSGVTNATCPKTTTSATKSRHARRSSITSTSRESRAPDARE